MKCPGCGAQIAPDEKKCPYCGTWREEPKVEKVVKIIEKPQEPICHNPNNSPVQNRKPFIEQSKEFSSPEDRKAIRKAKAAAWRELLLIPLAIIIIAIIVFITDGF